MTKPSVYHSQGYTCAESIIKSYNEEHNTDIPVSIGSGMGVGMGVGMTVGSICGAVNASVVVIGYLKGRDNKLDQNEARKYSKELMNKVREKYNTEICKELKQNKISCSEIIDFSYDALNEVLES